MSPGKRKNRGKMIEKSQQQRGLGKTVLFLQTCIVVISNPAEEMILGNTRLYKRFKAVEDFDGAVQEAVSASSTP